MPAVATLRTPSAPSKTSRIESMRVEHSALWRVRAGYVLEVDSLDEDYPVFYVATNRAHYTALLRELTSRSDVVNIHTHQRKETERYVGGGMAEVLRQIAHRRSA